MRRVPARTAVLQSQLQWALNNGRTPDRQGYLSSVDLNLRRPFSPQLLAAFTNGSGNELKRKMLALHSSSALVVNFFEYWADVDSSALLNALGVHDQALEFVFEAQHRTGLDGSPPNLDLCIHLKGNSVLAIESKFTEWLSRKSARKLPFKDKYFPDGKALWSAQGLYECQRLAEDIQATPGLFRHLDAPQLLKHALGLATQLKHRFALHYVYFDYPCHESSEHAREIAHFVDRVGVELRFQHYTYQQLFERIERSPCMDDYLQYLEARYFPHAAQQPVPGDGLASLGRA